MIGVPHGMSGGQRSREEHGEPCVLQVVAYEYLVEAVARALPPRLDLELVSDCSEDPVPMPSRGTPLLCYVPRDNARRYCDYVKNALYKFLNRKYKREKPGKGPGYIAKRVEGKQTFPKQ